MNFFSYHLEARSQKLKVKKKKSGWTLSLSLETAGENLFFACSTCGACRRSLTCGPTTPISASPVTLPPFLYVKSPAFLLQDTYHWI